MDIQEYYRLRYDLYLALEESENWLLAKCIDETVKLLDESITILNTMKEKVSQ